MNEWDWFESKSFEINEKVNSATFLLFKVTFQYYKEDTIQQAPNSTFTDISRRRLLCIKLTKLHLNSNFTTFRTIRTIIY